MDFQIILYSLNQIDSIYVEWQKKKKDLSDLINQKDEYKTKKNYISFKMKNYQKLS